MQSAARSKERTIKYTSELEKKVKSYKQRPPRFRHISRFLQVRNALAHAIEY